MGFTIVAFDLLFEDCPLFKTFCCPLRYSLPVRLKLFGHKGFLSH